MAANGNGWTKWLVATLWGVIILVITFMANGILANDRDSRTRDEKLAECDKKLEKIVNDTILQNQKDNNKILLAIGEMGSELRFISQQVQELKAAR